MENLLLRPAAEPSHGERFFVSLCRLTNSFGETPISVLLPKHVMGPEIASLIWKDFHPKWYIPDPKEAREIERYCERMVPSRSAVFVMPCFSLAVAETR